MGKNDSLPLNDVVETPGIWAPLDGALTPKLNGGGPGRPAPALDPNVEPLAKPRAGNRLIGFGRGRLVVELACEEGVNNGIL